MNYNPNNHDDKHGGPYDRGRSDAFYKRDAVPHHYPQGSYIGKRVTDLKPHEEKAYHDGYDEQIEQDDDEARAESKRFADKYA